MGDQSEHSLLSASGAPRWTRCYGSVALESTQPNVGSKYAAEGTAAHALGSFLLDGQPNKVITEQLLEVLGTDHFHAANADKWVGITLHADGLDFVVDQEMANAVQAYVDYCRSLGGIGLVETRVNYANWLGVAEDLAWGTSDFIAIHSEPETISIDEDGYLCDASLAGARTGRLIMTPVDYKHGAGVPVYPRWNEQAVLYAGGALNEIDLFLTPEPTDIIRVVICQPRIDDCEVQEWYVTVKELKDWLRGEAATAAAHAVKWYDRLDEMGQEGDPDELRIAAVTDLVPGEKQCKFCNAKAICPALTNVVVESVAHGFTDLTQVTKESVKAITYAPLELAEKMALIPLIEATITAWREQTKALLLAEEPVGELWLKKGKKGDRKWIDAAAAAKRMVRYVGTAMAFKPREPISPTKAEEMFKAKKLSAKQWSELQKLYGQADGGPTIALPGEKGERWVPPAKQAFTPIAEDDDADLSYLV